ncbi:MAG: HDOD domain-containing protein, partial [Planctomycetota bacterium]|nr:HDOD domain-containing protein [Planctomycetota bacterium]
MGPHRFDELRLARNLPSPSALGLRILELTRGEDFEQAELVELLRSDPALTGRILQLANAAASGAPVADVHEAAMRLGARTIRSVALGFTLLETRVPGGGSFQADLYWSRALAVAVSAQGLAEDAGLDPVTHFTLGLLSEVGQLALACVHTERYSRVWEDPRAARRAGLMALEVREFEIDHVEVSACLLRDWGLPDAFVHALLAAAGRLSGGEGDHATAERSGQVLRLAQALGRVLSNDPREPVVSRGVALDELLGTAASLGHDASALLQRASALGEVWRSWARTTGVRAIGDPLGDLSLALVQARLREPAPVPMVAPAAPLEHDPFALTLDAPEVGSESGTERPDRVLLVESRAGAFGALEEALESGDYETLEARGHRAALELALHMHPQVVLIESPADPGPALELLRVLRRSTVGRSMHLIVLTGATREEVSVDLLDAGADDVLVMPAT